MSDCGSLLATTAVTRKLKVQHCTHLCNKFHLAAANNTHQCSIYGILGGCLGLANQSLDLFTGVLAVSFTATASNVQQPLGEIRKHYATYLFAIVLVSK